MNRELLSTPTRQARLREAFRDAALEVIAGEREAARAAAAHLERVERLRVAGLALHFVDQSSGGPQWSEQVVLQRTVVTELAVGAHLSETDARRKIDTAEGLAGPYRATRSALEEGLISYRHAEKIVQHGLLLPPECIAAYEARLLPTAQRVTVQRLEREARAAAEEAQPSTAIDRHTEAAGGRCLTLGPAADGMAWLTLFLPAVEAVAIHNRVSELGRALKSSGDPRTLAQLRVDALADLALNGETSMPGAPRGVRAHVRVTVPALTLLGTGAGTRFAASDALGAAARSGSGLGNDRGHEFDPGPAMLDGYGPIDRRTALELTRDAPAFYRVLTDPATGVALNYGRDRYKVPAALDELVRTVHSECTFPLSCTSAAIADLDHTIAFADGGETSLANLSPLCASHHKVKHHTEWKIEQHPGADGSVGSITWTSPAGFAYVVDPTPIARPLPQFESPAFDPTAHTERLANPTGGHGRELVGAAPF